GGVAGVVDTGKDEFSPAVTVEVRGLKVVEMSAVPVLMEEPPVGSEQHDLGRIVEDMRGGDEDDVRQAFTTRCYQETCKAENRREFLGAGADAPSIGEPPPFDPARVVADQRCTLLRAR